MHALAAKVRVGTLTDDEQAEVEAYSRVGSLLGILQSRARRALKRRGINEGEGALMVRCRWVVGFCLAAVRRTARLRS